MVETRELRWHAATGSAVVANRELPEPQRGELLLGHTAIAVDVAPMPSSRTAVGRVLAVGSGVDPSLVGTRMVHVARAPAMPSSHSVVPAFRCVAVPDELDDVAVTAMLRPGLAAEMLCRRVFKVAEGHRVLVRGVSGAVGGALAAWSRQLGALVLGTVRTEARAELAWQNGCHRVVAEAPSASRAAACESVVAEVLATTQQRGVDVVFDGVGGEAVPHLLSCLRHRGTWVAYGDVAGAPPPLAWSQLHAGSHAQVAPSLADYVSTRDELQRAARSVFLAMRAGFLRPRLGAVLPLWDAVGSALTAKDSAVGRIVLTV